MSEAVLNAQNIGDWTNLGIELPAALSKALDVFEETRWIEAPQPLVEADKLTVKNIEQAVEDMTQDLLRAEKFAEAKRRVLDALARRVLREASAAVPSILEQLQPRFNTAVAKFREAVAKLPEELSSDSLVKAGPDAVAAYAQAQEASSAIHAIESWLSNLRYVSGYITYTAYPTLRVFAPETPEQLTVLRNAHTNTKADPLVRDLGQVLFTGVRAGVPMQLNTPKDSERIEQEIQAKVKASAEKSAPSGVMTLRSFR